MLMRFAGYWCLVVFWAEVMILLWLLWNKTGILFFKRWLLRFSKILPVALYLMHRIHYGIKISPHAAAKSHDAFFLFIWRQLVISWEFMSAYFIPYLTLAIIILAGLPMSLKYIRAHYRHFRLPLPNVPV